MNAKQAPVALGFRAGRGGSVVVGVTAEPRLLLSTFLATGDDRLSLEPYHMAAELVRAGKPMAAAMAAVAEGRKRQEELAIKGLDEIAKSLAKEGGHPAIVTLLVNRAGWITDLLEYSLFAPEHPPVAEGLAVRDALRAACKDGRIDLVEMDEKSLTDVAAAELGLSADGIEKRLKEFGIAAGKPWRKEQKLACLAGWLATKRI
jgi:hypothetical protein